MFSLITSYEDAWKAIIMPPRQEYTIYDLGLDKFNAKQNKIQRLDFQLINKKGYILECSFYQQMNITTPHPCVVYSHGSGCSRLEALQYLDLILSHPISFFTFDFTGSGKSGGLYSTVGWFEQEDLECVIDYIRCTGKISKIALWGRSMGATTSIFYGAKHGGIECMILDSPFANFKKFIKEFIKKKLPLPGFLASGAFDMIRSTILKKANFDLGELKPIKHINKVKIPLLFGVGEGDTFVPIDHTIDLHAASRGEKKILHVFEGDHNSTRPPVWMKYVSDFLVANLLPPTKKEPGQYVDSPTLHTSPSVESDFSKGLTQFSPAKQYDIKNFVEPPPSRQFTYFTTLQDDELLAKDQKVYRTIASNEDIVKKTAFKKGKSNEVGPFQRNEISPESPSRYKGPSILKSYQDPEYPNILTKNSFTSHTNSSFKHSESTELYGGPKRVEQKTGPKLVISDPREMVSKGDKTQKPESQGHLNKTKGEYVHSGRGHHRAASSINGSLPTSTNTTSNSYTPHYMQKIDQHPASTFSLASLNLHTSESPTVTSSNSVYNSNTNLALGAQGKKSSLSSWLAVNPKNLYAREKSEIPLSDPNNKSPSKRHNQTTLPNYEFNRGLSIKVEVHNPSIHYNQVKTPNDYSKPINFSYGTTYQATESFSHISSMNSTSATNSYSAANIKGRLIDMKGNNESGQASSYDDKFRVHPIAREYMTNERKMSVDNLNGHKSRFHTNRS